MASKSGKFLLGAVIGAAAGVVAGLLAAPKSGKETRADLRRKADELKTKTEATVKDIESQAKTRGEEVRDQADELRTRVENAVEGAKEGFEKRPLNKKK